MLTPAAPFPEITLPWPVAELPPMKLSCAPPKTCTPAPAFPRAAVPSAVSPM